MTSTHQNSNPTALVLRIATPQDKQGIEELHSWCNGVRSEWPTSNAKPAIAMPQASWPDDHVLVAALQATGRIVAAVKVGIALNQAALTAKLGHLVALPSDSFPMVTLTEGLAMSSLPMMALRLEVERTAWRMTRTRGGYVKGLIGLDVAPNPPDIAWLLSVGYALDTSQDKSVPSAGDVVVSELTLERMPRSAEALEQKIEEFMTSYDWQGPRLFAEYLS